MPPGRYFRMLFVGYFEGLESERGIAWRCANSLSLRQFLKIGTSEPVPDHSTLSRTRARLPLEVKPTSVDATSKDLPAGPVDVVVMNPPFGTTQTETGRRQNLAVFDPATGKPVWRGTALDHAIALNAGMRLKPGGKMGLVMGGPNPKVLDNPDTRRQAYNHKAPFFSILSQRFDIERHITVPGKMYERQGAGWPIDILVATRRETPLSRQEVVEALPSRVAPTLVSSWEGLEDALVRPDARRLDVSRGARGGTASATCRRWTGNCQP